MKKLFMPELPHRRWTRLPMVLLLGLSVSRCLDLTLACCGTDLPVTQSVRARYATYS